MLIGMIFLGDSFVFWELHQQQHGCREIIPGEMACDHQPTCMDSPAAPIK
jgi:hypothetical protein